MSFGSTVGMRLAPIERRSCSILGHRRKRTTEIHSFFPVTVLSFLLLLTPTPREDCKSSLLLGTTPDSIVNINLSLNTSRDRWNLVPTRGFGPHTRRVDLSGPRVDMLVELSIRTDGMPSQIDHGVANVTSKYGTKSAKVLQKIFGPASR
ncbi:hypothetical protein BASA62_007389 [Batrachochytrium salamandrivorans]|nr:hypothetical protein BASA62_007389 [Batrachochytrium salamandrivorans]